MIKKIFNMLLFLISWITAFSVIHFPNWNYVLGLLSATIFLEIIGSFIVVLVIFVLTKCIRDGDFDSISY